MTIETEADLVGLREIGRIVALALKTVRPYVQPGITTCELDEIIDRFLVQNGAVSAPQLIYNFPGAACISVNDEAAHGVPGERVIKAGDLVNIDVSAAKAGYFADTAVTIPVAPIAKETRKLCSYAKRALQQCMNVARAGQPINKVGKTAEAVAKRGGFTIIRNLPGHGVGRSLHEAPDIPNFYHSAYNQRLHEGLVITIEPFVAMGARFVNEMADGWTLQTDNCRLSAQYEHTIVVQRGKPLVLTAV